MKKKMKRIVSCAILLIMMFAFCADAFAASVGYVNNQTVKSLKTWTASVWRSKSTYSEPAVFNAKKYNGNTPGYITDKNGNEKSIWWRLDYKTSSGTTGQAMNKRLCASGVRDSYNMDTSATSYTYRLVLYNAYANYDLNVHASYTPG